MKKNNILLEFIKTMSNLQDLLSQYSTEISARNQHQNDTDTAVSERKANTLEEHFQNAKDAIESGGAELGGAGAAFHLGRKIYRQVKTRQAARAKAASQRNSNATDQQERVKQPTQQGQDRPTRPADGATDDPAPQPAPEGGRAAVQPREDLGTIAEEPPVTGGARTQLARPETGEAAEQAQADINRVGAMRQGGGEGANWSPEELKDIPLNQVQPDGSVAATGKTPRQIEAEQSGEAARDPASVSDPASAAHGGADSPATETSNPQSAQGVEDRAAATQERVGGNGGAESADTPDFLSGRGATPLQETPDRPANITSSAANDKPSGVPTEQPSSAADIEEGAKAFGIQRPSSNGIASNTRGRLQPDGTPASDPALDPGGNPGSTLTKTTPGLEDAGLEGLSDALDFLGPVGEFAGLITGLIGVFEGVGHKDAPPDAGGRQGDFTSGAVGAGLDTSALTQGQPTGAAATVY